jgi:hypothetical protein
MIYLIVFALGVGVGAVGHLLWTLRYRHGVS